MERALELGFISSVIDAVGKRQWFRTPISAEKSRPIGIAYGYFVEGSLSPEVASAGGVVAAIGIALQYYIRAR